MNSEDKSLVIIISSICIVFAIYIIAFLLSDSKNVKEQEITKRVQYQWKIDSLKSNNNE